MKGLIEFIKESADRNYSAAAQRKQSFDWISDLASKIINTIKRKTGRVTPHVVFYVDNSGSIYPAIKNIYKGIYSAAEQVQAKYKVNFEIVTFTNEMSELTWGNIPKLGGPSYDFPKLLTDIDNRSGNATLNVIVTDEIFAPDVKANMFKNNVMLICSSNNSSVKKLKDTNVNYINVGFDFSKKI